MLLVNVLLSLTLFQHEIILEKSQYVIENTAFFNSFSVLKHLTNVENKWFWVFISEQQCLQPTNGVFTALLTQTPVIYANFVSWRYKCNVF